MMRQFLRDRSGIGCAVSDMAGQQRRGTSMANSAPRYDPAGRYEVKVEDVEYRRDGEQSLA